MRYYTTGQISPNRRKTPEGYLLCLGVPIARTGAQDYLPDEVTEEIADDAPGDTVKIRREADEVFAPETVASFEGKPVTLGHPEDGDGVIMDVLPANWRELARGVAQNVRRGEGNERDLLLADLLITDAEAVALVESGGLREISCGYDAELEATAPGEGRQRGIIGNHVALVESGRCGPRCAIKDNLMEGVVTKKGKPSFWDRLLGNPKFKKAFDEAAAEEAAKDNATPPAAPAQKTDTQQATDNDKSDEILVLLRSILEKLSGTPAGDNDPEPGATGDEEGEQTGDNNPEPGATGDGEAEGEPEKAKAGDARGRMADTALFAAAKNLAPGLVYRVGDSACMVKRTSLRQAMSDASVQRVVDACLRGRSLDNADCVTLDAAFTAASELVRAKNSNRTANALKGAARDGKAGSGPMSAAEVNELNRKHRDSLNGK